MKNENLNTNKHPNVTPWDVFLTTRSTAGKAETTENTESAADQNEDGEKRLDPRVESLAIPLARDYAEKNYTKKEDGTFEPAWRGANGEKAYRGKSPEQIAEEEGISVEEARTKVIDIANQPYNEFNEYWKEQNRGGAEFLISLLDKVGTETIADLDLDDEETRKAFGDAIHENWLSRNEWAKDDPNLGVPFTELSEEEQQKDIDQLGVLQKWLAEQRPPQEAPEVA